MENLWLPMISATIHEESSIATLISRTLKIQLIVWLQLVTMLMELNFLHIKQVSYLSIISLSDIYSTDSILVTVLLI